LFTRHTFGVLLAPGGLIEGFIDVGFKGALYMIKHLYSRRIKSGISFT